MCHSKYAWHFPRRNKYVTFMCEVKWPISLKWSDSFLLHVSSETTRFSAVKWPISPSCVKWSDSFLFHVLLSEVTRSDTIYIAKWYHIYIGKCTYINIPSALEMARTWTLQVPLWKCTCMNIPSALGMSHILTFQVPGTCNLTHFTCRWRLVADLNV